MKDYVLVHKSSVSRPFTLRKHAIYEAERLSKHGRAPVFVIERVGYHTLAIGYAERGRFSTARAARDPKKRATDALEAAIAGADARGYTGMVGSKGSAFDDPVVKRAYAAYDRAIGVGKAAKRDARRHHRRPHHLNPQPLPPGFARDSKYRPTRHTMMSQGYEAHRVRLDKYGYVTSGFHKGTYYGVGEKLWIVYREHDGRSVYVRAPSAREAKTKALHHASEYGGWRDPRRARKGKSKKFERCVRDVKKSNKRRHSKANPWAVCHAAMKRKGRARRDPGAVRMRHSRHGWSADLVKNSRVVNTINGDRSDSKESVRKAAKKHWGRDPHAHANWVVETRSGAKHRFSSMKDALRFQKAHGAYAPKYHKQTHSGFPRSLTGRDPERWTAEFRAHRPSEVQSTTRVKVTHGRYNKVKVSSKSYEDLISYLSQYMTPAEADILVGKG